MNLSRYTLKNISDPGITVPTENLFELPEKVLQFGTGVLLRGLPDYFIDKANRMGIFNGRIVVVKSTTQGDTLAFEKQDSLFTLCARGVEHGVKIEENIINASISRVLHATDQWSQVLECAHNSHMEIIVSNTTEIGIQLINDDIRRHPPVSFPGKLLAFLYERFIAFGGSAHSGMVIIPTELIPDNGLKLESIVLELAHLNGLEANFIEWIEQHNFFCNSLVDRIVPGKPDTELASALYSQLGYKDQLLTVSEIYRLWAIEGNAQVKKILSFEQADKGIVIETDIRRYRELKLRMLNGTHTLTSGVAFLAGCDTVEDAMKSVSIASFISNLMFQEIAPAIPYYIPEDISKEFGLKVLDRFRNPHIKHQWISITMNYTSKMKMRCIPLLLKHYESNNNPPEYFVLGFAAYILFMKPTQKQGEQYFGESNGESYLIRDEQAPKFYKRWIELATPLLVEEVVRDSDTWECDLYKLPGFYEAVLEKLNKLLKSGMQEVIGSLPGKKAVAV